MRASRILIFGGTGEARVLADRLVDQGFHVVTALAGVTSTPKLPRGEVHRGRLGGAEGIAAYAASEKFDLIVDATHPFAAQISTNIAAAAGRLEVRCARVERDAWLAGPNDRWTEVTSFQEAAAAVALEARALITIGHRGLEPFLARKDLTGIIRLIEPPDVALPQSWRLLIERPPHTLADELRLFDQEQVTVLVTKNSGGEATFAKLIAARERKIPVVMIARPPKPSMLRFSNVETLVEALKA